MTHNLTLNEARVVYAYFDETGEVVYIGMGTYSRPYHNHRRDQKDQRVNIFMNERFAQDNDLRNWIKYVGTYLTEKEARNLEGALIRKYRPRLNSQGSGTGVVSREVLETADRKIGRTLLKMGLSKLHRSPRQALSFARRSYRVYRSKGKERQVVSTTA